MFATLDAAKKNLIREIDKLGNKLAKERRDSTQFRVLKAKIRALADALGIDMEDVLSIYVG